MIILVLDLSITRYFMQFFFNFERVLSAIRGFMCVLRGCSRTLKIHNYPPLHKVVVTYVKKYLLTNHAACLSSSFFFSVGEYQDSTLFDADSTSAK